ncbi:MAG: hypothetical protein F3745_06480 [Nitrospinae bacterium]|nr:hypothetical protein [Nitrospinota bacterium]
MKLKLIWLSLIVTFAFTSVNWAAEPKGELVLYRETFDPFTIFRSGRICENVFYLERGRNAEDLRDMRNKFCEGEYSMTLDGPPGTTVTLYGQFFYGEERGAITVTKTDNRQVWIWDLEDFPDRKWVVAEANKSTGGYEVFYKAVTNFKNNIGSVKWDESP